MSYTFNDWIKEEKQAIKNKCACSLEIKLLRKKIRKIDIDLEICPCNNKHTYILGHCIVCGAREDKNSLIFIK